MSQNESVKIFLRFIQEKHQKLIENIDNLYESLVSEDKDNKIEANEKLLDSAHTLSTTLSETDKPQWLKEIIQWCSWYVKNNNSHAQANKIILDKLIEQQHRIKTHTWLLEHNTEKSSYNFDDVYERFKSESKLPELFDELISILEKMISSGEVDSIKTISGLRQLLDLLKQNKSGSYFSTMASWEFLRSFIKNTLWESLDSIPVVKQLKKGFEKTVTEMDVELEEVHKFIAEEMSAKYNTTVYSLTYKKQNQLSLENKQQSKKSLTTACN